jgi:hypothetical protein
VTIDLAAQADGRILAVGIAGLDSPDCRFALARYGGC